MNTDDPFDRDEAFALGAYSALPRSQPPAAIDARISAAAHAVNATRRPRRWATGLATAAVAVLAVGVAWRGLEPQQPDYAPAAAPQIVVPTMQPAFKLETAAPADKNRDASRDDARARTATPQTPTAPALSSADWEAPVSGRRSPERGAKPQTQSIPEQEPADVPVFDEPLPMAFPASAPAAPPAPLAAEVPTESKPPDERSSQPTEQRSQLDSPAGSEPAPLTTQVVQDSAAKAVHTIESEDARADRQEQDMGSLSKLPAARAPAGVATPFAAEPQAAKREQPDSSVVAESAQGDRLNSAAPASAQTIRAGFTPYLDAVAAARAAGARGDTAAARTLAAAIVARFGQHQLPSDLRAFYP